MAINPNLWGITEPGNYAAVDEQGKPIIVSIQQHGWSSSPVENPESQAVWDSMKKVGPGSQDLFNALQDAKSAAARGVAPDPKLMAAAPAAADLLKSYGINLDTTKVMSTVQGPTQQPAPIPFKAGLSQAQQQSILNLVASRPPDQWNATDKANWAYATNNAPLPSTGGTGGSSLGGAGSPPGSAGTGTSGGASGGTSGTSSGTGGASGAPPVSAADQRAQLQALGIDVSQLNDSQVENLYAMKTVFDSKASMDKDVLPKQLTASEMQKFLQDAQAEIQPYFRERLKIGGVDILNSIADLTGDIAFKSQQQEQQNLQQQKAQADQMAEAGLAYSGIRNEAEQQLKSGQEGIVRSQASQYSQQLRKLAGEFEKQYGSGELAKLNIPALSYAGVAVQPPQPYGGLMGEEKKTETAAETKRQQELALNEYQKRFGLSFNAQPNLSVGI